VPIECDAEKASEFGLDCLEKRKNCWRCQKSNRDFSVTEPVDHSLYQLSYAGFTLREIKKKILYYFISFSLDLLFLVILLVCFISYLLLPRFILFHFHSSSFLFFRFSFPSCPFHQLIIIFLFVTFSSFHSGFLIPVSFHSRHFLPSLCHSHFSNVIIFLRSPYLLSLCCSISSIFPSPSPSCSSAFLSYIIHSLPASPNKLQILSFFFFCNFSRLAVQGLYI
jgi:hypothetical protein